MKSPSQQAMDIADLLEHVRRKGVRLWSENGALRYKAPKGALTREEIERIRVSGDQVLALLERSNANELVAPKLESRRQCDRVPLTFTQLTHWRARRLGERPGVRQLASATRLRGRLHIDLLRQSLADVVRRHEALRTQIVIVDEMPMQEIYAWRDYKLEIEDLVGLPQCEREAEVQCMIDRLILEPIHLAVTPLLGMRLVRVDDDEHVLILAMEHMISDAFSMNILLRDIFTIYTRTLEGHAPCLPLIPVQFADYAVWQKKALKSWIHNHQAYWDQRLRRCQRLRFPEPNGSPTTPRVGWGNVSLQIGEKLKAELREWCRVRRTTLVIGVFTAYVGLVLRWCNAPEMVIRYQTDGRLSPKVENAIGFFASILNLRIELRDGDSFVDLLSRVTAEYCSAYEHADFAYLETLVPQPGFMANTVFNWVSQEPKSDLSALENSNDAIAFAPVSFTHPVLKIHERDGEPSILLYDIDETITGGVLFPLSRFSIDTMERFERNFLMFLQSLLREPQKRVKDILLL